MRRLPTSVCSLLILATLTLTGCGTGTAATTTPTVDATPILPAGQPGMATATVEGGSVLRVPEPVATVAARMTEYAAETAPYPIMLTPPTGTPAALISAADLKAQGPDTRRRIIDMGTWDEYVAGHLPGADHLDWSALEGTDTQPAALDAWQRRMVYELSIRGISATSRVVIYDHGTLYGARLWWVLDQLGQADKQILDGGFAAWQAAGGAVDTHPNTYPAVSFAPQLRPDTLATKDQVQASLGQAGVSLVDARSPDEYAAGHIPGAVNIPFSSTAGGTPPVYKTPAELHALFAAQGISDGTQVITYCSTGVRGSTDYVAARRAGFPNVRLYTGSWAEWSRDPQAPVQK